METNIKPIPILTPTFEQWKALGMYLTQHETSLQRRFGAVKIIPPSRWIPLLKNPYDLQHMKMYVKQAITCSSRHANVFYIKNAQVNKRRVITYDEFKCLAESDAHRVNDTVKMNMIEHFWSTLSTNVPLYIPNIDDTLFDKRESVFNMASLPSLLTYYPKTISGVTTPHLHMGMWSSTVGLHIDEHDLISLNYLHFGAPRIWYIIHPSSYSRLEELVNELKLFSEIFSSCLSPLQHKSLLLTPSFLRQHSIDYYLIEQKLHELTVIFPGTYHFYFDTGFNITETTKYALPSYLEFQRRSPRLCSCSLSPSSMTQTLNRRFFTEDILVKFRNEYLTSASSTLIDLSADDTPGDHQDLRASFRSPFTTLDDLSMDPMIEPIYLSLSSIDTNTPVSTDGMQHDIWNLVDPMPLPTESSLSFSHRSSRRSHLYSPYSSPDCCYSSVVRSSTCTSLDSHVRTSRRKCYACRQRGHVRKECPHVSRK